MSAWQYAETPDFVRTANDLSLSLEVREAIKKWAVDVGRVNTNKQKHWHRTPQNKFEIWTARIPDPDSNRGSSGGFRLTYFFNLADGSIYLDVIERRSDLGGKNERPRDQQKYNDYLERLKAFLHKQEETLCANE